MIGKSIRDDQLALVNDGSASVDNIRNVSLPFVFVGRQQRFAKTADDFAWIITIQERSANAVLAQGADTMAEDQPTSVRFDR